jgi:hypothetical protein
MSKSGGETEHHCDWSREQVVRLLLRLQKLPSRGARTLSVVRVMALSGAEGS